MKILGYALRGLLVVMFFATGAVAQDDVFSQLAEWSATSKRAEEVLENNQASTPAMEALRATLIDQRTRIIAVETKSKAALGALQSELAALGDAPEEGAAEAPEIAARRAELQQELAIKSVPLLAAHSALTRVDSQVAEINAIIRQRFTDKLLELGPTPFNPALWLAAAAELGAYGKRVMSEVVTAVTSDSGKTELKQKLPLALLMLGLGLWFILGLSRSFAQLVERALAFAGAGSLWFSALSNLAGLVMPTAGAAALIFAVRASDLLGLAGSVLVDALPQVAAALIAGPWLGRSLFHATDSSQEDSRRTSSGHRIGWILGAVYALETILIAISTQADFSRETQAVLQFPLIVLAAYAFYRLSRLIKNRTTDTPDDPEAEVKSGGISYMVSQLLVVVALLAPVLSAVGYFAAAQYLVYPTIETLAFVAALLVIFDLTRAFLEHWIGEADSELRRDQVRLVPVFFGFLLTLVAIPVLALFWGASPNDLREIWGWLNDGISIGDSRFSLSDLLLFVLVFGVGYTITKVFQRTVKNTVLPRTRIDIGGRSAILTGINYLGIFLSALAAISATGLDLSSLAIVAGALSVGVGFGLQTIVSNFVSGIILLIERPIKEGDWITAGGFEGTVRKISVRATLVDTFDRCAVIIPNSELIAGSVQNWTAPDVTGRVKIPIGVAYGTDPERVRDILLEIGKAHPMVMGYPAPKVVFQSFGASSLDFEMRVFLRDINNMLTVKSDINFAIAARFAKEGIEIPFTQSDVTLRNVDEIGEALNKALRGARDSG